MINISSENVREDCVFDRPLYLAGTLDNAADELNRTWWGYEWNDRTRCNCGFVARQIMQTNAKGLKTFLPPIYENGIFQPSWSAMSEKYCSASGLSRNEVFAQLLSAGLRTSDFIHLEELSHPEILGRMETRGHAAKSICKARKSDVIAYLRTWAAGIEEFRDRVPVEKHTAQRRG